MVNNKIDIKSNKKTNEFINTIHIMLQSNIISK